MPAPAQAASTSGPGALSQRTDSPMKQGIKELSDAQYGEAKTFRELQQGAPMAKDVPVQATAGNATGNATGTTPSVVPLNAPTTRPDEPVTAGSQFGPGVGPEALGNLQTQQAQTGLQVLQQLAAASSSPAVAYLAKVAGGRL